MSPVINLIDSYIINVIYKKNEDGFINLLQHIEKKKELKNRIYYTLGIKCVCRLFYSTCIYFYLYKIEMF